MGHPPVQASRTFGAHPLRRSIRRCTACGGSRIRRSSAPDQRFHKAHWSITNQLPPAGLVSKALISHENDPRKTYIVPIDAVQVEGTGGRSACGAKLQAFLVLIRLFATRSYEFALAQQPPSVRTAQGVVIGRINQSGYISRHPLCCCSSWRAPISSAPASALMDNPTLGHGVRRRVSTGIHQRRRWKRRLLVAECICSR